MEYQLIERTWVIIKPSLKHSATERWWSSGQRNSELGIISNGKIQSLSAP